jgi:hypothetical protein
MTDWVTDRALICLNRSTDGSGEETFESDQSSLCSVPRWTDNDVPLLTTRLCGAGRTMSIATMRTTEGVRAANVKRPNLKEVGELRKSV